MRKLAYQALITVAACIALMLCCHTKAQATVCVGIGPAGCTCTVNAVALGFGPYSPATPTPLKVSATSTINCTSLIALSFNVIMTLSTGSSNSFTQRTMLGPSNAPLGYNVYTTAADTSVFGDGTAGTQTVTITFALALPLFTQTLPVTLYGAIPAGYGAPSGTFNDSLILTVNY